MVEGEAAWVGPTLPGLLVSVYAQIVGTGNRMWLAGPAMSESAQSVAQRWCARSAIAELEISPSIVIIEDWGSPRRAVW